MSDYDMIIGGGTVATASDTLCGHPRRPDRRGARMIDATDRLVLPGGIDSHVHVSQPSGPASSWLTISRAALGQPHSAATHWSCPFACSAKVRACGRL